MRERTQTYQYRCKCPPTCLNGWTGGLSIAIQPAGNPSPSIRCPSCHRKATLIERTPPARNTGGRRYPYYSITCGREFASASEHRHYLKNPTDFKGRPRQFPDGTLIQFHEV